LCNKGINEAIFFNERERERERENLIISLLKYLFAITACIYITNNTNNHKAINYIIGTFQCLNLFLPIYK